MSDSLLMLISLHARSFLPVGEFHVSVAAVPPARITFCLAGDDFSTVGFISFFLILGVLARWPLNSAFFVSTASGHPFFSDFVNLC